MRNRILDDQNNVFAQQWQESIELAKANLIIAQARQKHYYDRSLKECSFEPNDVVLLKILKAQKGKFAMRWNGPYVVIDKLSNLNYLIRHQDDTYPVVVHVNRMRKWNGETKFNNNEEDTENEETPTTIHTNPDKTNTATTTHINTEVSDNIVVNANNESEDTTAVTNEKPTSVTAPEEPTGIVKRKRGRPRKEPTAPKITIPTLPHTHALRKSVRLPK